MPEPMPRSKRYKNWRPVITECVWCGDNFRYWSPLTEDGHPKRVVRYCSRLCVAESNWEGRRKTPPARTLAELYVMKQMSVPALAKRFHCANSTIHRILSRAGVAMREHTSVRTCIEPGCGQPAWKKFMSNGVKKCLTGTRCREHSLARYRASNRKYSRRDPLTGTRRVGRKPVPRDCPRCGVRCETTRASREHCRKPLTK